MMGYYSTVYFACHSDQHKLILAATELEPDIVHGQETSNDEEIYCCEWNYVKWGGYNDAEATAFEELLSSIESSCTNTLCPFGFMRIGEEHNDVEFIGDPNDFGIHYRRYLEWG